MEKIIIQNQNAEISAFKNINQTDMLVSIYVRNLNANEALGISLTKSEITELKTFLDSMS